MDCDEVFRAEAPPVFPIETEIDHAAPVPLTTGFRLARCREHGQNTRFEGSDRFTYCPVGFPVTESHDSLAKLLDHMGRQTKSTKRIAGKATQQTENQ